MSLAIIFIIILLRMGAIFFVIMSTVFANLGAVELFIAEKMLFL